MAKAANASAPADDAARLRFFRAIAGGDDLDVTRMLDTAPTLAVAGIHAGATRQDPKPYFIEAIRHHVYAGDTALHIAAAAHERAKSELLVAHHAEVRTRNRRGAEPLHYAADGRPGAPSWNPDAQRAVIEYLIAVGADPNGFDNSGVAPLHRAVRTRAAAAVRALLQNGAEPRRANKRGSTPLHLAVQNTGRSDSGAAAATHEQRAIIAMLLQHGARPTDTDASGKTAAAAAASDWIRELLND